MQDEKADEKADKKAETSFRFVVWRINSAKCDYAKLQNIDTFSCAGKRKFDFKAGDKLYAVASGPLRSRGLLGIWEIIECYHGLLRAPPSLDAKNQNCWLDGEHVDRKTTQWRVIAKKIRDTANSNDVKPVLGMVLRNMQPTLINMKKAQLLDVIV
jgi:hypothetical protein